MRLDTGKRYDTSTCLVEKNLLYKTKILKKFIEFYFRLLRGFAKKNEEEQYEDNWDDRDEEDDVDENRMERAGFIFFVSCGKF